MDRREATTPVSTAQSAGPGGHPYTFTQISSYALAKQLLRQGHSDLNRNGDGMARRTRC